jgi:hypothetical protein
MVTNEPLIHIGYVKTGSTWLQKNVTNNSSLGFKEILERSIITNDLIKPYLLYYEDSHLNAIITQQLQSCLENNLIPVVTHERLSGNPISGGYDAVIIADRLKKLMPNAKILIVIREQLSFLVSCYNEYVNGGGACSFKNYIYPPDGAKLPLFNLCYLEFHYLINYYRSLFSPENVLVLPFEFFKIDTISFVNEIISFMGGTSIDNIPFDKVRVSKKPLTIEIERYLNFYFFRDNSNPSAPFRVEKIKKIVKAIDIIIPNAFSSFLKINSRTHLDNFSLETIKQSNKETSKYTQFSLSDFGYLL